MHFVQVAASKTISLIRSPKGQAFLCNCEVHPTVSPNLFLACYQPRLKTVTVKIFKCNYYRVKKAGQVLKHEGWFWVTELLTSCIQ